ncbi:MAG: serine hydrolase [Lewinella sp.]
MKTVLQILLILFSPLLLSGQLEQEIDDYLAQVNETNEIPGSAIAILKGDEVIYEKYFGMAELDHQVPVSEKTLFRVYSSTKLLTSVAIFQLVDAGKISVGDQIGDHLNDLPDAWNKIAIRDLLSHASGLPDLRDLQPEMTATEILEKLGALPLSFPPGDHYQYNQTNYWLLSRIIEVHSDKNFGNFVIDGQFGGDNSGLVFSSNALEVIPHRTGAHWRTPTGWVRSGDNNGRWGHAANGMAINMPTLIGWAKRLNQGKLLSKKATTEMTSPYFYTNSLDEFLHGWGVYHTNKVTSRGFTGGLVSGVRFFPEQDLTILFMSNGFRYFPLHNRVIDRLAGMVDKTLFDEDKVALHELANLLLSVDTEAALTEFSTWRKQHPNVLIEGDLNSIGYAVARDGRVEDAIKIFQLNTEEYPDAWNVWDSLGEGYEMAGDHKKALKYYTRSVKINPDNQHGIDKIKLLKK